MIYKSNEQKSNIFSNQFNICYLTKEQSIQYLKSIQYDDEFINGNLPLTFKTNTT